MKMRSGQQDLYVPAYFDLPSGHASQEEPPLGDTPQVLEGADPWDMPAIDVPCDPGPSENELSTDPFPEWELFLDFDELQSAAP